MKLNPKKCKELRICFLRNPPTLSQLTINNTSIEVVESHKLLGVLIQDDLKWRSHILSITKKAAQRLYILRVLRRNGLPPKDLLSVYTALIRSVLEYACPVWHSSLPSYLVDNLEQIQRRAFRIIEPLISYRTACNVLNYPTLEENRERLCLEQFKKIKNSQLSSLIPQKRLDAHGRQLRSSNNLTLFKCRTKRFQISFFPAMTSKLNELSQ